MDTKSYKGFKQEIKFTDHLDQEVELNNQWEFEANSEKEDIGFYLCFKVTSHFIDTKDEYWKKLFKIFIGWLYLAEVFNCHNRFVKKYFSVELFCLNCGRKLFPVDFRHHQFSKYKTKDFPENIEKNFQFLMKTLLQNVCSKCNWDSLLVVKQQRQSSFEDTLSIPELIKNLVKLLQDNKIRLNDSDKNFKSLIRRLKRKVQQMKALEVELAEKINFNSLENPKIRSIVEFGDFIEDCNGLKNWQGISLDEIKQHDELKLFKQLKKYSSEGTIKDLKRLSNYKKSQKDPWNTLVKKDLTFIKSQIHYIFSTFPPQKIIDSKLVINIETGKPIDQYDIYKNSSLMVLNIPLIAKSEILLSDIFLKKIIVYCFENRKFDPLFFCILDGYFEKIFAKWQIGLLKELGILQKT